MLAAVGAVPGGHTLETAHFADSKAVLKPSELRKEMLECKLCLVPPGVVSPDTFRLSEALGAGCIPIIPEAGG
jgi:hypothetical protein